MQWGLIQVNLQVQDILKLNRDNNKYLSIRKYINKLCNI